MREYDIIITGAGPAGLFCAVNCAAGGSRKILVLEKNQSPGKKLLLSGSGQCNITHSGTVSEFAGHYGKAGTFTKPALNCFTPGAMLQFLHENNIRTTETETGKIFPESKNAGDVLSVLTGLCAERGATPAYGNPVTAVHNEKGSFRVYSGKRQYTAPVLVIATGGCSYPSTGSTGDGYAIAKSLGHSIVEPLPALTPVYIKDFSFAGLSGMSISNTQISVYKKEKRYLSSTGDVLFTHKGLSGPGILDISRHITAGDIIKISVTGENTEKMLSDFIETSRTDGKKHIKNFLKKYEMPVRLIKEILAMLKIEPEKSVSGISRAERMRLFSTLGSYPFTVDAKGGFNIAMVTCGGVSRDEINRTTMESKLVPGLYFAGEVADIDGDTGGYNIQWAFSSAKLAAENILKSPVK